MAERRMISRRVALSKKIAKAPWEAEALYLRCIPFMDDAGNLVADPEEFRALICPMGKQGEQLPLDFIQKTLLTLAEIELIQLYSNDGNDYLHITKYEEFQTLKNDRKPTILCPGLDDPDTTGIQWNPMESLIEVKGTEVKGREGKGN